MRQGARGLDKVALSCRAGVMTFARQHFLFYLRPILLPVDVLQALFPAWWVYTDQHLSSSVGFWEKSHLSCPLISIRDQNLIFHVLLSQFATNILAEMLVFRKKNHIFHVPSSQWVTNVLAEMLVSAFRRENWC